MEHRGPFAGPGGPASRMGLLDLPDELLLQILRKLEDESVKEGETSAEFLQLRTVCKRLQRAVDSGITNLSRGIARKFCRGEPLLEVKGEFQCQLARWGRLHRVELHVRGSNCALSQLIPALGESCPGLTALRIVKADLRSGGTRTCRSISHLTSLISLESLSLTGFGSFTATLPPLPSLRSLDANFKALACPSPLPALEELVVAGAPAGVASQYRCRLDMPHLHTSSRLRRLSLARVFLPQQLRLPKSLRTLHLVYLWCPVRVDLGQDLPELVEVLLVHEGFPLEPEGLSPLLSRGHLRRLKVQGSKLCFGGRFLMPEALSLETGLMSLSLRSVHVHSMQELSATLTALTELKLSGVHGLDHFDVINVSCLNLQRLKLEALEKLHSIEGLGLQTGLTSLALTSLPGVTHLPELSTLRGLTVLKLATLRLRNWTPDCCAVLPRLNLLRVSDVAQLAPLATSSTASARLPLEVPTTFLVELKTLHTLTELDLWGFAGSAIDLASLPLVEKLRLRNCLELSEISGTHSLPHLRSLELSNPLPKLRTLDIASCPSLTAASFRVKGLWHLTMEDLPRLPCLEYLPRSLRTVHVAACHSLKSLPLKHLPSLVSLELMGVPRLHLPRLQQEDAWGLKSLKLDGLATLSCLIITNGHSLERLHVSGSPLTELVLDDLPKLTAPKLHINDLDLHGAGSALFPLAPPLPPPTAAHQAPPGLPPVHPLSGSSPPNLQGLRSLTLRLLRGQLSLDRVALQTGLRELMLEGLQVSCMPRELASLSTLSRLMLMNLRVGPSDPLPPDSLSRLVDLSVRGSTELLGWTGLRTGLSWDGSPARVGGGSMGRDVGPFRSIRKLELSDLWVASLDVSQLSFTLELTVLGCQSLTCLAGITDLPSLTSVRLVDIPKLQKLAILSCPKLVSIVCLHLEPLHLHMEDLPSLSLDAFCFHNPDFNGCPKGVIGCFPGFYMTSLTSLKLRGLPNVSRLFVAGHKALATVEITHCRSLKEVNLETLNSLTSLRLDDLAGGVSANISVRPLA